MLKSLLTQLKGQDIVVFDDNSDFTIEGNGVKFHKFKQNHGKKRAWLKFKKIFDYLKDTDYDYYYLLPDDVEICDDFINKTLNLWKTIDDDRKICLSFANPKRCEIRQFTHVNPKVVGDVVRVGWFDMMAMFTKKLVDFIEIDEIPLSRWDEIPTLGSGVGSQMSNKFVNSNFNLYNCNEVTTNHLGNGDLSLMNTEIRKNNPL
jgi:hypothetical protein